MTTYRSLLAKPLFARLFLASTLARIGQQMAAVALVLVALQRFGSAALAGATVFLAVTPGLLLSPFAGALLDRHGRIRLITVDNAVAAAAFGLLAGVTAAGLLRPWVLLALVAVSSLTVPLGNTGTRVLYPLLLPRREWDRANGLDSSGFVVAALLGPPAAAVLIAAVGDAGALLGVSLVSAAAAVVIAKAPEPVDSDAAPSRGVMNDAREGLLYVLRSPSLRGLAVCVSVFNVGGGILVVALPVLVLRHLHGGTAAVGVLFALQGAGGLIGALVAGRHGSEARERSFLGLGMAAGAVAMLVIALAPTLITVGVAITLLGACMGPVDVGLFALRQRRTHPGVLGRAFAVSMSLNFIGFPIGSALGGPLAERSVTAALLVGAVASLGGAVIPGLLIPRRQGPTGVGDVPRRPRAAPRPHGRARHRRTDA